MARILILSEFPSILDAQRGMLLSDETGEFFNNLLLRAYPDARFHQLIYRSIYRSFPLGNATKTLFLTKTEAKKQHIGEQSGKYPIPQLSSDLHIFYRELEKISPDIIIALGDLPLWALTGNWGITSWRGSHFHTGRIPIISTFCPRMTQKKYENHIFMLHDLSKLKDLVTYHTWPIPDPEHFIIGPSADEFERLVSMLLSSPRHISVDLETIQPYIACVGIAWSKTDACCIPFFSGDPASPTYYPLPDLFRIASALRRLLTSPNISISGQNYSYDSQFLALWLGIPPSRYTFDTMVAHHTLHPTIPKGLGVLSSLYRRSHMFWKDEGKQFDYTKHDPLRLWTYNCRDAVATWEIKEILEPMLGAKAPQFQEQMAATHACLRSMLRGISRDNTIGSELILDVLAATGSFESWLDNAMPEAFIPELKGKPSKWYRSPKQQAYIFYSALKEKPVFNRKTGALTTDDTALSTIAKRTPLLRPLCDNLLRYRSLGICHNVLTTKPSPDGRIRCSFSPTGTYTYRLSSSEDAFGDGTNLQNISTGEADTDSLSPFYPAGLYLPNIRKLFKPDPGYILLDIDLARADAQNVAGYAGDYELLVRFDDPDWDMHTSNAIDIFGPEKGPGKRKLAKAGVHAVNYLVMSRTLASTLGCSISEAQHFIDSWFLAHPLIRQWQKDVEAQIQLFGRVTNVWGYSVDFYSRKGTKLIQDALAWLGQSTTALLINKIWLSIEANVPWAQVLLQVHDSLVLQIPAYKWADRREVYHATRVPIPFPCKKHYIDVGLKASGKSWGDVKEEDWG